MKTLFLKTAAILLSLAGTVAPSSAQSLPTSVFYVTVDGIPGESEIVPGAIDIVSFQLGVQQKGVTDFGGGAAAGKSSFLPLKVFKSVDKASPLLFLACATGKHIPKMEFRARLIDSQEQEFEYLTIKLTDVLVSSVNHESADNDGRNILLESVSFNYAKLEYRYVPRNPNGSPGTPVVVGFDLKKNKLIQIAAPLPTK